MKLEEELVKTKARVKVIATQEELQKGKTLSSSLNFVNHNARNCKNRKECKVCKKQHPTSLHDCKAEKSKTKQPVITLQRIKSKC